ncbi:MAG: hypothetical protein ACR2NT_03830 [Acidimicrobiia bacterium]
MSTRQQESQAADPAIVDTVVLRYFLLVDQFDLLTRVLGQPVAVSRVVYDPDDAGEERAMSEIVRSIHVQRQKASDISRSDEEGRQAEEFERRLSEIHSHFLRGAISVVDMTESERNLFGRLSAKEHTDEFGLIFPLDEGESATLAIAVQRGWVFASDDGDALRAMISINRRHPYQRIRKLLIEAVDSGLVDEVRANEIHAEMRRAGFWDRQVPFP